MSENSATADTRLVARLLPYDEKKGYLLRSVAWVLPSPFRAEQGKWYPVNEDAAKLLRTKRQPHDASIPAFEILTLVEAKEVLRLERSDAARRLLDQIDPAVATALLQALEVRVEAPIPGMASAHRPDEGQPEIGAPLDLSSDGAIPVSLPDMETGPGPVVPARRPGRPPRASSMRPATEADARGV